jgi:hypothetical protein
MKITMTTVHSSNVHSVGYDAASKTLAVRFHSGEVWHYADVPSNVARGLAKAKSVGQFFSTNVRSAFKGTKQ